MSDEERDEESMVALATRINDAVKDLRAVMAEHDALHDDAYPAQRCSFNSAAIVAFVAHSFGFSIGSEAWVEVFYKIGEYEQIHNARVQAASRVE